MPDKDRSHLQLIQGEGPRPKFDEAVLAPTGKEDPKAAPTASQIVGLQRADFYDRFRTGLNDDPLILSETETLISEADASRETLFVYLAKNRDPLDVQLPNIYHRLDGIILNYLRADAMDRLEGLEQRLNRLGQTELAKYVADAVRTARM